MKKKISFSEVFKIPIYDASLEVIVSMDTIASYNNHPGTKDLLESCTLACFFSTEDGQHVLILPKNASIGVIAHECFHAAIYILTAHGITLAINEHEAFAYFHEYLVTLVSEVSKRATAKLA